MLAVGLSLTVGEILLPLRNRRLVSLALLANFVLMPLAAWAIAKLLRLDAPLGAALLLLGSAAGAPFLPKLAAVAKGSLAFAVGLMVVLMALTVGYMPLVLPLLLNGVSVDPLKIARSLVLLMLIPLVVGLAVKNRYGALAARVAALLNRVSTLSLILLIVLLLATNVQNILDLFGTRGVLASILFLFASFGTGWLSTRRSRPGHARRAGPGYRPAKYRGCAGGRRPELPRSAGGRHGGRGGDCRAARPDAARAGRDQTQRACGRGGLRRRS